MNDAFIESFLGGSRDLQPGARLCLRGEQGEREVQIRQILRILPAKRVVCVAELEGQQVLLKLFATEKKGVRERHNEQRTHAAVQQAGIPCPALLFAAETPDGRIQAVSYQFLQQATSAAQHWLRLNAEQQQVLWQRVSRLVAAMHEAGLYQQDIHLENFLLTDKDNKLYVIDLGSILQESAPLAVAKSIDNLGLLIAQFNLRDRAIAMSNLQAYCDVRQQRCDDSYQHAVYVVVDRHWQRRRDKYLKKIFRDCSEIRYQRSWTRELAAKRHELQGDVAQMVEDPQAFMTRGEMIKQGNSATVVKVTAGGRTWIIKRYNVKSFWHGLRRGLRRSRAAVSWRNAHHLEMIGLPTVAPLAFIEKRFGPVRLTAYLICEYVPSEEWLEALQERIVSDVELRQLAVMFRLMSTEQLSHGDLKAKNILLSNDGQLLLIDLDAMQHHASRHCWSTNFRKDMQRFLKNWQGANREKFTSMLFSEGFLERMSQ